MVTNYNYNSMQSQPQQHQQHHLHHQHVGPAPPQGMGMSMIQQQQHPPISHSTSPHPSTPNSISSGGHLVHQASPLPPPMHSQSPHQNHPQASPMPMHPQSLPQMQPPPMLNRPSSIGPSSGMAPGGMAGIPPSQSPHQHQLQQHHHQPPQHPQHQQQHLGGPPPQNFYPNGPHQPPAASGPAPPPPGLPNGPSHIAYQPGPPHHGPPVQMPIQNHHMHNLNQPLPPGSMANHGPHQGQGPMPMHHQHRQPPPQMHLHGPPMNKHIHGPHGPVPSGPPPPISHPGHSNCPSHHNPGHHHHHGPPPPHHQQGPPQMYGRNSPYTQNLLQTELRILEFNRRLQLRPILPQPNSPLPNLLYDESTWWDEFGSSFFDDDATLTVCAAGDKSTEYTIGRTLIPRFFRSYFDGGVNDLSVVLKCPRESYIHPNILTLDCDRALIITNNNVKDLNLNGLVAQTDGHLLIDFVSNSFDMPLLIKSWRFRVRDHHEFMDRNLIHRLGSTIGDQTMPKLGFTKSTIQFLKMCVIIEPMQDLMATYVSHLKESNSPPMMPKQCLRKLLKDKYNYAPPEEALPPEKKKRSRRNKTNGPTTGATNKRSKANANNRNYNQSNGNDNNSIQPMITNNGTPSSNINNLGNLVKNSNNMHSPVGGNFNLGSLDVHTVGEPTIMGGSDVGDENERLITRFKNTQYEQSTASTPLNTNEDSTNTTIAPESGMMMNNMNSSNNSLMNNNSVSNTDNFNNNNGLNQDNGNCSNNNSNMELSMESQNQLSPSMIQQQPTPTSQPLTPQQQQQQMQQQQSPQVSQHPPTPMQVLS